jgi:hypothetical protein
MERVVENAWTDDPKSVKSVNQGIQSSEFDINGEKGRGVEYIRNKGGENGGDLILFGFLFFKGGSSQRVEISNN